MLVMCHLFIGLVIGLMGFQYLGDRRVIILAALGSVLPDLIDKPLGHILLNGSVDFGRIYAHSGLFLIALLVAALAYRRRKGSWILLALAAGTLSHLVLDSMWQMPVTVFYPLLGDFGLHHFPDYVGESLAREIGNTYEWVFGVVAVSMLMFTFQGRLGRFKERTVKFVPLIVRSLSFLLMIIGLVAIVCAALSAYNPLYGDTTPDQNLIVGLASSFGGLIAYRIWDGTARDLGEFPKTNEP
jgi:membrane-bound metal-dependent hydrolase YbcI (DUF457 family)